MFKKVDVELRGKSFALETGRIAKQAGGAVIVQYGETVVLVTAVCSDDKREGIDFFPLTVDYQERLYAAGQIPGNFFRREMGRPSDKEVLTSRLIDRPIRPLFPDGFYNETQVIATVISYDGEHDAAVLSLVGASAALTISDAPFEKPIAGVRVGRIDGELIINPTRKELEKSDLDLIVAGSKDAIVMVEAGANFLSEKEMIDAIYFGHREMQPLIDAQLELQAACGKSKRQVEPVAIDHELVTRVENIARKPMEDMLAIHDKLQRQTAMSKVSRSVLEELGEIPQEEKNEVKEILHELQRKMIRGNILDNAKRIGDRRTDEVRPISCETGLLPRVHGSALFQRGETQALVTTTLGSSSDQQRIDSFDGDVFEPFILHYNFPPFCVGEARMLKGPGRREIGHGNLALRAIKPVLPDEEQFPYTIRIVSDIMESNGSSSMATVCGGTLSLMDAGVPIKKPVAGVAMGLVKEGDKIAILTDILGDEDHYGDMDFKVTGTDSGITALQMDIKVDGLTEEIMVKALEQARHGRLHILSKMNEAISESKPELSAYAPRIHSLYVAPEKVRDVIGPGGKVIRGITADTGVKIDIDDDGKINLFSHDAESLEAAEKIIEEITQDAEVGKVYKGLVKKIVDFGAFVEILPKIEGLVHISQLDSQRVNKVDDIVSEGDEIDVQVLEIADNGKIRLSRKALLEGVDIEKNNKSFNNSNNKKDHKPRYPKK